MSVDNKLARKTIFVAYKIKGSELYLYNSIHQKAE